MGIIAPVLKLIRMEKLLLQLKTSREKLEEEGLAGSTMAGLMDKKWQPKFLTLNHPKDLRNFQMRFVALIQHKNKMDDFLMHYNQVKSCNVQCIKENLTCYTFIFYFKYCLTSSTVTSFFI
jgi:hypothetical protein